MNAWIGPFGPPGFASAVEIVHVPERASLEAILPDIVERALDLALGLGPIRLAGALQRAVIVQQRHHGGVVFHHISLILADHGGLHPVIEDFLGHAALVREGRDMAGPDRLQVLAGNEAAPEPAAVLEHHQELPDLAEDAGLIGELGKIDLGACWPGGVSNQPSNSICRGGRTSRRTSVTAVEPPS